MAQVTHQAQTLPLLPRSKLMEFRRDGLVHSPRLSRDDWKEEDLPLSGQDLSNEIATINSKDRYNSSVVVSSQAAQ